MISTGERSKSIMTDTKASLPIIINQEHLDSYIELVNRGEMSFTTALEELVEIEKRITRYDVRMQMYMLQTFRS